MKSDKRLITEAQWSAQRLQNNLSQLMMLDGARNPTDSRQYVSNALECAAELREALIDLHGRFYQRQRAGEREPVSAAVAKAVRR